MSDALWHSPDGIHGAEVLLEQPKADLLLELDLLEEGLRERLDQSVGVERPRDWALDGGRMLYELRVLREVMREAAQWAEGASRRRHDEVLATPMKSLWGERPSVDIGPSVRAARELAQTGFGKLVLVQSTDEPSVWRVFRVAHANWSTSKHAVVSRGTALAAQLVSARPGDEIRLAHGQIFEVVLVAQFRRYFGAEHPGQTENFREIEFVSDTLGSRKHHDARASVEVLRRRLEEYLGDDSSADPERLPPEAPPDAELSLKDFYLSATRPQEDLMRRDPEGLVVVLGIAGSGKTSVALGRTKMLCDARPSQTEDDEDDQPLWRDDLVFQPDQVVGFVLSEQLVPYLKGLAERINLSGMAVREYRELQQTLMARREIGDSQSSTPIPFNAPINGDEAEVLGRMAWLKLLDHRVAHYLAVRLVEVFAEAPHPQNLDDYAMAVLRAVWANFVADIRSLGEGLSASTARGIFRVEGLVAQITQLRKRFTDHLEEASWWLREGESVRRITASTLVDTLSQGDMFGTRTRDGWEPLLAFKESEPRLLDVEAQVRAALENDRKLGRQRAGGWEGLDTRTNPWRGSLVRLRRQRVSSTIRERLVRLLRFEDLMCDALAADAPELTRWQATSDREESAAIMKTLEGARRRAQARRLAPGDLDPLLAITELLCRGYVGSLDKDPISHMVDNRHHAHVFIDEFQDFTEIQLFLMSEQAHPKVRSVTAVGDLEQQLTRAHRGRPLDAFVRARAAERDAVKLTENKRQTPALAALSGMFRRVALGDESIPEVGVTAPAERPAFIATEDLEATAAYLIDVLPRLDRQRSVAVICADRATAEALETRVREPLRRINRDTQVAERASLIRRFFVHFTEPLQTKGMEFDMVFVPQLEKFDLANPLATRGLYVALSRPVASLTLLGKATCLAQPVLRRLVEGGWLKAVG